MMTNKDDMMLMKKLRPDVIISDELLTLFKHEYPADSFKLARLQAMLWANEQ